MKKILSAIIGLVIFVNFSVCQAKMVRFADDGAEILYASVLNILSQTNTEILLSNLLRTSNLDIPEHGLRTWLCAYYSKDYSDPIGEIMFFVNGEGYVSTVKIVSYYNKTESFAGYAIASIFFSAGMSYDESNEIMESFQASGRKVGEVWCQAKNRNLLLMELPRVNSSEGKQFLLAASIK